MMRLLQQSNEAVIYFVQEEKNTKNADMKRAYSICLEAKLKPKIVTGEESSDVPPALNVVFVLEEFAGNVFKALSSSDSLCRVVGPRCLSYCVENEIPIPENNCSVFCMAMKGLVITSSRLSKSQKEEIASLIGYMGGVYSEKLTSASTHLVCDEGKSQKCETAVEHKIPIMRTDWVKAVWEASKSRDVLASHAEFAVYRLSPFKGMVICCSNLPPAVKNKVQQAVKAHGGVYSTALEQNKTTALIIGEAEGKKFQAAQLWSIPCLTTDWVFDSAEQGIPLPSRNYLLNARPRCSTPTNDLPSFMSADVSCIPFGNASVNKTIDETSSTFASAGSFACQPKNVIKPQPTKPDLEYKKLVNDINLVEAAAAGLFLDGCKVYLSGFFGQDLDKMKKLINKSGATLFPEINDRLTHVIQGDFLPEHVKEIEKLSEKPCVVSVAWILASVRLKTPAPTDPYLCFKPAVSETGTTNKAAPPSPLSSKGLSLLKADAAAESQKSADVTSTSTKSFVKARVQRRITPDELDDGEPAVIKPGVSVQEKDPPITRDVKTPPPVRQPSPPKPAETNHRTDETEMSSESSSVVIGPFFKDLVFLVIGFGDPTKIIESVNAVGGKVESCNFQGIADFAVVPLDGVTTQLTATEIVTPLWVEDCYDQNKVVPVEYYHQPVSLKSAATPLEGCVICVSGYIGKERTFMFHLADSLGAIVQESFSRKDCPRKNVRKSTHLICKTASGSKYNAAIQWGIPVVNESWLIACVSTGAIPPIKLHQFNDRGEPPVTPSNPAILRVKAAEPVGAISCVDATPVRTSDKAIEGPSSSEAKAKEPNTDSFVKPSTTPEWNSSLRRIAPDETPVSPAPAETAKENPGALNSLGDDMSAFDGFCTPNEARPRTSVIGSAGKSPFHVDTPSTPYGRIFMKEGENPSPATRKKWKKYIDSLPDMQGSIATDSPEVQEFRRRRPSTPLSVIVKQVWVKFGKAEIEGIDPSGDLLPDGPFGQWAHENEHIQPNGCKKPSASHDQSNHDNPNMSAQDINEKMSILKSRLDSVLTSSQQKAAEEDNATPQTSNQREPAVTSSNKPKANEWFTPKTTDTRSSHAEILWDFGKPVVTVPSHNPAKKLRLSDAESDRSIDEQMSKFFEKEESTTKEVKRIFTFSQVQPQTREKFENIVKNLGGEVYSSSSFDPKITHLVVDKILRSEKYLCAVASGKWVLHSSYLTQCYQSRMFLPEEDYEWGNERSRDRLPSLQPGTSEWNLAHASHKWRVRRTDLGQPDSFRQFKAVILTSAAKLPQFMRLLQAGNATLLPKERILEATHVFWDEDKAALPVEKAVLKAKKIPLLQLVYLGDYLAKNPPPDLNEYVIR